MGVTLVVGTAKGEVSMLIEGKVGRSIVLCFRIKSCHTVFFLIIPRFIFFL